MSRYPVEHGGTARIGTFARRFPPGRSADATAIRPPPDRR